ncbi:hypothetical protein SEVIR_2G251200v4 [Setaria viridis]|uniref:C2H2-type domain-containing protein n=2 Tax=Setaria viridis TaxID=4556 RepID=A0A4U6VWV1_SETVI|nr:uncharacterized protein LOC117843437 [Setaria viridis]TKW33625.1 hypothetical protein SEVIR_2G251200v2 [Setaria viridis]
MGTEVAAVVDLGAFSQSDLVALAAASPYAVDPRRGRRRDGDFLPPPKIDRAVFNESSGSRKQTFSRHRPATNISHNLTPTTAAASPSAAAVAAPAEEDSENRLIVFHLQRLFARDDPSYPAPPAIPPRHQTLTAPATTAPAPLATSLPPPPASVASAATDPDREVLNPKGVAVDLARLAELVDPYGVELQQRTAGLGSESELLGFMNALEGQWGSRRRRRKFVDAGMFADHLPRGWKLLLGLKRKERVAWINCRRYVSPKGHQFATCKEVSTYLRSLLGYPEAKPTTTQINSAGVHDLDINSAGHQQTISIEQRQLAVPLTSVTLFSHSGDSHGQKLQKDEAQMEVNPKECRKCNLTFHDQGAYMQHQLSFHQRKAKRRRVSKSSELGTYVDGNYETQQKTLGEGFGNSSHGVADVRYQGQSPAKLFDGTFSGQLGVQPSLKAAPLGFQEMTVLPQLEKEPSAGEPVSMNNKDPPEEMSGFPEQERESAAGEPISRHGKDPQEMINFPEQEKEPAAREAVSGSTSAAELEKGPSAGGPTSGHHLDAVDNSDHRTHDETCDSAVASLSVDAESKLSTCNATNFHENDCSKDLELSNTDHSQKSNRSDETYGVPKEVSPAADDPVESKSTNDLMECTDITQTEQVSQPYDLLHGKFGSSEGNDFHNQLESNPLSGTRDEPDLNSIGMEVDDGNITCSVENPTSFKSERPLDDKIMECEMTSLKEDGIKSGVTIRNVNLNSCSDTISSPVSGGNYETSSTPDDAIRSSIIAQCFGTNSNDENAGKDGNFANQNSAGKGENFVSQENDIVYQSNLTMGPIPPAQINVDCFTSCSMTPEIKSYGNRGEDDGKEALVNSQNMASNETGFDVETYNSDIFNSTITESSLAQLNNAINMKNDFASCYSLSDLNTLTGGSATDEIDIHGMRNSFVSSTSRTDQNEHCTLDFDIKGSMLEALEKSDSDLDNQYNGAGPSCDSLPAAGTNGNIDDFMSMQTNFGSFTSLVRAVEDVPLSRILQDQCDLQLGFGGPKQPMYPSFEQQLRMASAGAPPYGNMGRHDTVPVPEPTLMLGYAPPLGSCPPPFQLGWGAPSYSKMVGVLQSVCVWCNSQFQHFGTIAEQQADSLGYICPSCKGKFSGHLGINGPSI